MKKTLHMVCPHCKLKAELNIQEEAEMILMRCVSCESPFLYFHGETFSVDEKEMENLKQAELKEVEGFLKVDRDDDDDEDDEEELDPLKIELSKNPNEVIEVPKEPLINLPLSKLYENSELNKKSDPILADDLLNLKIDLENSEDVLDFLEKI